MDLGGHKKVCILRVKCTVNILKTNCPVLKWSILFPDFKGLRHLKTGQNTVTIPKPDRPVLSFEMVIYWTQFVSGFRNVFYHSKNQTGN
jgi:hypothetical protein